MSLVAACVPHYIIGIALAAGIFGFHMLCEGFFKVKSEIPVCCPSRIFASMAWRSSSRATRTRKVGLLHRLPLVHVPHLHAQRVQPDQQPRLQAVLRWRRVLAFLRHGRRRRGRGFPSADRLRRILSAHVLRCGIVLFPHRAALRQVSLNNASICLTLVPVKRAKIPGFSKYA